MLKVCKFPGLWALFFVLFLKIIAVAFILGAFPAFIGERTTLALPQNDEIMESAYPYAEMLFCELEEDEIVDERYYRLVDTGGDLITITGRRIRIGDRYLDEQNRLFEVYRVTDYVATARYIRTEDLGKPFQETTKSAPVIFEQFRTATLNLIQQAFARDLAQEEDFVEDEPRELVAIYHTHNAESYVPDDGTHSIYGRGGIHDVGVAFKEALEDKNIDVIHSETFHLPHDRGAYRRSRNTALELLQHNPDVMFDVHRDAAPIEAYAVQIEDDWVTQVQFVVGRQNPSYTITRRFAYDLKSLADEVYPGLIKGVFMGWGNYNQDLTPLKLLLEVGGHQNSKDAAKGGVALFADVVALYFYGIPPEDEDERTLFPRTDSPGAAGGAVAGTIAVILLLVGGGVAGFYFLNNPAAWSSFKEQLHFYLGRDGLVWKDGYQNLILMGKKVASGARGALIYLLLLLQLFLAFAAKVREKLKQRLQKLS